MACRCAPRRRAAGAVPRQLLSHTGRRTRSASSRPKEAWPGTPVVPWAGRLVACCAAVRVARRTSCGGCSALDLDQGLLEAGQVEKMPDRPTVACGVTSGPQELAAYTSEAIFMRNGEASV